MSSFKLQSAALADFLSSLGLMAGSTTVDRRAKQLMQGENRESFTQIQVSEQACLAIF